MFASPLALATLLLAATQSTSSETRADALFDEGRALLGGGKIDEACAKLEASLAEQWAGGVLAMLAYCHEKQGHLATAFGEYEAVAERMQTEGDLERAAVAKERAKLLLPSVPVIVIVPPKSPSRVSVELDGQKLGGAQLRAPLLRDPGSVTLRVTAPGHLNHELDVQLVPGAGTLEVEVPDLVPEVAEKTPATLDETRLSPRRLAGLSIGASGLGLALAGGFFGVQAIGANAASAPHCSDNACDDTGTELRRRALDHATLSTLLLGSGALAVGVGGWLYFFKKGEQQIALGLLPEGTVGAHVRGTF